MSREEDLKLLLFTELRDVTEYFTDKTLSKKAHSEYEGAYKVLRKLVKLSGFLYDYNDWREKYDTEREI